MRIALRILVVIALLGVNLASLYAVLHPHTSPQYKAYYIDKSTQDWAPDRYSATPEEGMKFAKPGLPTFVESTRGLSVREAWGRWTDLSLGEPAIKFRQAFSGPICVVITAYPSEAESGKQVVVAFGAQSQSLHLTAPDFADYYVNFVLTQPANTLEFHFPDGVRRNNDADPASRDIRRLGLAISSIRLSQTSCATIAPQKAIGGREAGVPKSSAYAGFQR